MQFINEETGQYEKVSNPTEAFKTGRYSLPSDGESFVFDPTDQNVYKVPNNDLPNLINQGKQFATDDQIVDVKYQQEFGNGVIPTARAGAEEAARTLSFGLSDPAMVRLGIDPVGLRERKNRNPAARFTGAVAGIALPVAGSAGVLGKASGPVEKIGAGVLSSIKGGQYADDAVRAGLNKAFPEIAKTKGGKLLFDSAGKAAMGATETAPFGLIQPISEDALGESELTAEKLLFSVGGHALFGGIIGGAIPVGGALIKGTGAKVGKPIIKGSQKALQKAFSAESLQKMSDRFGWRALGYGRPLKNQTDMAAKRFGSPESFIRKARNNGILRPGDDLAKVADRTAKDTEKYGQMLGNIRKQMDDWVQKNPKRVVNNVPKNATVEMRRNINEQLNLTRFNEKKIREDLLFQIDNEIKGIQTEIQTLVSQSGTRQQRSASSIFVNQLKNRIKRLQNERVIAKYTDDELMKSIYADNTIAQRFKPLADAIGKRKDAELQKQTWKDIYEEFYLNSKGDTKLPTSDYLLEKIRQRVTDPLRKTGIDTDRKMANYIEREYQGIREIYGDSPIPFQKIFEIRKKVDNGIQAYGQTRGLKPDTVEAYKNQVRWIFEEEIEKFADDIAKKSGFTSQYKKAKELFGLNKFANEVAEQNIRRFENTNLQQGLIDNLLGTGFGIHLASSMGWPGFILGAYGGRVLANQARRRYAFAASHLTDKMSKMAALKQSTEAAESAVSKSINRFIKGDTGKRTGAAVIQLSAYLGKGANKTEKLIEAAGKAAASNDNPERIQEYSAAYTSDVQDVAPNLSFSVQTQMQRANIFLSQKANELFPELSIGMPSDDIKDYIDQDRLNEWEQILGYMADPKKILAEIEEGYLTENAHQILNEVFPQLKGMIVAELLEKSTEFKDKLTYDKRIALSQMLDMPFHPTMDPQFIQSMQMGYEQMTAPRPEPRINRSKSLSHDKMIQSDSSRIANRERQ